MFLLIGTVLAGIAIILSAIKKQDILTSNLLYNYKEIWHNTSYELLRIQLLLR